MKFFIDICKIMPIQNKYTTKHHPQSNRQVERNNSTILATLLTYDAGYPRDWHLYTDALTYAYNFHPHTFTYVAPFDLMISKQPLPIAVTPMT